jgi:hypothetical protein
MMVMLPSSGKTASGVSFVMLTTFMYCRLVATSGADVKCLQLNTLVESGLFEDIDMEYVW